MTDRGRAIRPVLLAWAFLAALVTTPYLGHALRPPPGLAFTGFFLSRADMYNYLTYVQQAEDGAFVFGNKLLLDDHPPALVNVEWWLVGRMSRALGRRPFLSYRLFALAVSFVLVWLTDRWLGLAGLPATHRLPALILVFLGGGFGGIRYEALGPPAWRSLDLITGFYPFIEVLANPHFLAGTTLLLAALLSFLRSRNALGVLLGTVLGLVRPYDLVLLVLIRALAVVLGESPRNWLRSLLPLAGLAPVAAYLYWVFYRSPAFSTFFYEGAFTPPPLVDFVVALGPAVALAALSWRTPPPENRFATLNLLLWAILGLLFLLVQPVDFFLQFLTGVGLPLLALASLGLSRFKPAVTLAVAVAMGTTAFLAYRIVLRDEPLWLVPAEKMQAAHALRDSCRPGDVLLAPPDIGLFAMGLTACKAYVSERFLPEERDREAAAFFGDASVAWRAALLDRWCITHVVLPGDPGAIPSEWLGEATPFRRVAGMRGRFSALSAYAREDRAGCARR